MLNYVLPIAASLIALLQLAKDWRAHQTPLRRVAALALIVLFGVGTAFNTYRTATKSAEAARKAETQHTTDQAEIRNLETAVKTANHDQETNTTHFLESFKELSNKVSDLQTRVTNEELQKKLASVQTELQKTQKAMAPGPKAELRFSFGPYVQLYKKPVIQTVKSLPVNPDGSVDFTFTVVNTTDIDAVGLGVNFIVCGGCKFAKESEGLTKIRGYLEQVRSLNVDSLAAQSSVPEINVEIIPPPHAKELEVGISYRCRTCTVHTEGETATVHLLRQN